MPTAEGFISFHYWQKLQYFKNMKYKILYPLFVLLIILAGCRSEEDVVTKTAKKFLEYMNASQYDDVRKMATPESRSMIDLLESMSKISTPSDQRSNAVENLKCIVNNDTANCTYFQNNEEKSLMLVKAKNKWLIDMKKESPSSMESDPNEKTSEDSYEKEDTITYFDLKLMEAQDLHGSAQFVFDLSNRSDYNIQHLWMTFYFSNQNGEFICKKDVMFNGILKSKMFENISNPEEVKNQSKNTIALDNIKVGDVGEIFIYPFRIQMELPYYEDNGIYGNLADLYLFAKQNTLIKNQTDTHIKIVF